MLLEFKTKNFMSIKTELVLSMGANGKNDLEDNINTIDKDRVLKSACIFGANASGKSNILKAFTSAILFIRNSNTLQDGAKIPQLIPFKFDNKTINDPSFFEFTFIANGTKYIYGFSADLNKVHEEYLYKYTSSKSSLIFKRTNCNKYDFPKGIVTKLNEIKEKNTDNKLFFSTANMWNFSETKEPFEWFMKNINTFDNFGLPGIDIAKHNNSKVKENVLKILSDSDISIVDYDIEIINRKLYDNEKAIIMANPMIANALSHNDLVQEIKISTLHETIDKNGESTQYKINMDEESLGTQKMFYLGMVLQDIFTGQTMIIDELENSLHPYLVEYIIKLFHDPKINKNNAQLIFTSHSASLLDLDKFRRDQINFVEKDEKTSATELYSLSDYSVRKDENIEKGYINGRYGAVPFIGNEL